MGLSKGHKVTANNLLGGTCETILWNLDDVLKWKLDYLIVLAGTNDLTNLKIK